MANPVIIYCRGGDKHAPRVAARAGMEYGTRYNYKPYAPIYMLDPGLDADWNMYLSRVREWTPKLALTPDFYSHVSPDQMLEYVEVLRTIGVPQIGVCPKFTGAVAYIPRDCIVAVSVPTSYAGFLPLADEVYGRKLHLLGGHPDQQLYLIQLYEDAGATVVSVDGNILGRKASLGQFWSSKGGWRTVPRRRFSDHTLAVASGRNIARYFSLSPPPRTAKRVGRAMYSHLLL